MQKYSNNPNLKGQKGLFTYVVDDSEDLPNKSLDVILIDEQEGNQKDNYYWPTGQFAVVAHIRVPENDFLFYRIRIPKDKKHLFLKQLYKDGYSGEYLFPGYDGAVKAMKNRIRLERLL